MSNSDSSPPLPALGQRRADGSAASPAHWALWRRLIGHRLVTNSSIYVLGQVLQKAFAFLLVPLYARFLTPDDYGVTGTLAAYSSVLFIFMLMGLHGAASKHYFDLEHKREELESYLLSIVVFQAVVPGAAVLALNIWGPQLWTLCSANKIPFDPYVRLMIWATYLSALLQIPFTVYQTEQKARVYVGLQWLLFLLGVVGCLVLVVALRGGAAGVLASQVLSYFVLVVLVFAVFFRRRFPRPVKWRHIRAGLVFGLPLLPHMVGGMIMSSADRMVLERYVPISEIGLYGMGMTFGMLLGFVATGINQAWSPYYLKLMKEDPLAGRKVVRFVSLYLPAMGGICIAGGLFAGDAIRLLLPPSYSGAAPYVAPVFLGNFFCGLYYLTALPLYAHEKTKWFPIVTGLAALLDLALNIWLVPHGGALAAAWVFALINAVMMCSFFVVSRRYDRTPFPLLKYGALLALVCGAMVLAALYETWPWHSKLGIVLLYAAAAYPLLLASELKLLRTQAKGL